VVYTLSPMKVGVMGNLFKAGPHSHLLLSWHLIIFAVVRQLHLPTFFQLALQSIFADTVRYCSPVPSSF